MSYKKYQDENKNQNTEEKNIIVRFLQLIGDVAEHRLFSKNVVQAYRAKVVSIGTSEDAGYNGTYVTVKIVDKNFTSDESGEIELRNCTGNALSVGDYVFVLTNTTKAMSKQNTFITAMI